MTGSDAVLSHLDAVAAEAEGIEHDDARRLLSKACTAWAKAARAQVRTLDAYAELGLDPVEAFRGKLPAPSAIGRSPEQHAAAEAWLIRNGWIEALDLGGFVVYRSVLRGGS